jgi:hypothetical protein
VICLIRSAARLCYRRRLQGDGGANHRRAHRDVRDRVDVDGLADTLIEKNGDSQRVLSDTTHIPTPKGSSGTATSCDAYRAGPRRGSTAAGVHGRRIPGMGSAGSPRGVEVAGRWRDFSGGTRLRRPSRERRWRGRRSTSAVRRFDWAEVAAVYGNIAFSGGGLKLFWHRRFRCRDDRLTPDRGADADQVLAIGSSSDRTSELTVLPG